MAQTDPRVLSKLPSSVITVISRSGAIHNPDFFRDRARPSSLPNRSSFRPRGLIFPSYHQAPLILRLSDSVDTSPSRTQVPVLRGFMSSTLTVTTSE